MILFWDCVLDFNRCVAWPQMAYCMISLINKCVFLQTCMEHDKPVGYLNGSKIVNRKCITFYWNFLQLYVFLRHFICINLNLGLDSFEKESFRLVEPLVLEEPVKYISGFFKDKSLWHFPIKMPTLLIQPPSCSSLGPEPPNKGKPLWRTHDGWLA